MHPAPQTQTHLVAAKLAGRWEAAAVEAGPFLPVCPVSELLMKPYQ